jgi:hypothetical protein
MQIQEQNSIQSAFGFSSDDLAENRMGRLSPSQKMQMRRGAMQLLFIALAFLAAIATLIVVFAGPADREIQVIIIGLIILVAFILVDTVGMTETAIMPGVVARVSGIAYISNEECFVAPADHPFNNRDGLGNYSWNSLYLDGEQFHLTKEQCKALPHGALVDVYYIPALRKIVAVDIIKTNESDDLSDAPMITMHMSRPTFGRDDIDDVEPLLG